MTKYQLHSPLTPELYCTNIKASLTFYIHILGFNVQYQREEDGFVMLERQGARIMLDQVHHDPMKRTWLSGKLEKPFGRGINLEIMTDNVDVLYEYVQNAGAGIFLPIEDKWYRANDVMLGRRQFIVIDPDGYMLRFSQDLGEHNY